MQTIEAQKRTIFGKKTKELRSGGVLPAVVYGKGGDSAPLSISASDFLKVWRLSGESTIINLSLVGDKAKNVLIHDIAFDSVTGTPIHVDFFEVSADKPIKAHVALSFIGESPAVKSEGGVLVKVMHEIEIEALPKDLPHEIQVDLSQLKQFSDSILLKDITLPKNVTLHGDQNALIVKVTAPRSEAEMATLTETAEVNLEAIEVTKKGKKEEGSAGEESTPSTGE